MSLDPNKVKARLASLQNKGGKTFEKTDFTKIYWKPKAGSQQVRIVPSKFSKDWPFQEVFFHKNIVKKTMYALTNFGEKDPIVEFTNALKAEAAQLKAKGQNSDEEWNLAKKLRPKTRVFAQVVVRGEENLGTRLWEFGPKVLEQLLKIAANDDYSNFTDIHEGVDLNVEGVPATFESTSYIEPSISPRKKESPLSKDPEQLKKFLDEQHDPLGFTYYKFSYDQIEAFFEQWLNPESQPTDDLPVTDEISANNTVEEPEMEIEQPPFVADPPKKSSTKKAVEEVGTKVSAPAASNKARFKKMFGEKS